MPVPVVTEDLKTTKAPKPGLKVRYAVLPSRSLGTSALMALFACAATRPSAGDDSLGSVSSTVAPVPAGAQTPAEPGEPREQAWNWHVQNTVIVQGDPAFPAKYSGPNSLDSQGEVRETVSLDLMAGVRLWSGAEAHVDGLLWQGFGLSKTVGIEAFPNGEAYRLGTDEPNVTIARLFLRQTINLGGAVTAVEDDQLQLAGKQDENRLTFTIGKISAIDIFDDNTYAHDPRTQFMNWAFVANEAWDYPADSIGYETGIAAEFYLPQWAMRYGFFQMPRNSNGMAQDSHYLEAWGMVGEIERRFMLAEHPGAIRFLAYLNQADMGSFQAALDNFNSGGSIDIEQTRAYRHKYGFGVNLEQEISSAVGLFSRLGWSDGHTEPWTYADVDRLVSLGTSVKGVPWHRPEDVFGLAGAFSGIARVHQEFLAAGGTGILAGDGALTYSWEKALETYYDFQVWKTIRAAIDYQFVADPAFNRDRGPVSIFGARLHWEY